MRIRRSGKYGLLYQDAACEAGRQEGFEVKQMPACFTGHDHAIEDLTVPDSLCDALATGKGVRSVASTDDGHVVAVAPGDAGMPGAY